MSKRGCLSEWATRHDDEPARCAGGRVAGRHRESWGLPARPGDGQSLGDFCTIVLYGRSRTELDQLVAEFYWRLQPTRTAIFFAETYNQLTPIRHRTGNYALNLANCIC